MPVARQVAFLWRWHERRQAPTTPGCVSFVATLRIVILSLSVCDRTVPRVLRRTAVPVSTLAGSRCVTGRGLRCCGGGRATAPDRGTTPRARPGLKGGSKCAVRSGGTGADHLHHADRGAGLAPRGRVRTRAWSTVRCRVAPGPAPAARAVAGRRASGPRSRAPRAAAVRSCGEDRPRLVLRFRLFVVSNAGPGGSMLLPMFRPDHPRLASGQARRPGRRRPARPRRTQAGPLAVERPLRSVERVRDFVGCRARSTARRTAGAGY